MELLLEAHRCDLLQIKSLEVNRLELFTTLLFQMSRFQGLFCFPDIEMTDIARRGR
jgi:hypothetical protein